LIQLAWVWFHKIAYFSFRRGMSAGIVFIGGNDQRHSFLLIVALIQQRIARSRDYRQCWVGLSRGLIGPIAVNDTEREYLLTSSIDVVVFFCSGWRGVRLVESIYVQ